ncbi:hypothetical protein [Sulfuriflexus mobilis]|uniref:hypothetical protein n=1 Tax=Sulfuriflexus mobilis TaxID=1811807 RepID=UPI000F82962F|nr:hypothetical protein [Sulfuriflexus mobilis]
MTGVITTKNTGVFMIEERAQQIAEQWLTHAAESAGQKDLKGHMGMISKRVSVQGVPGFDNIDYDIWHQQCRHQFENAMIKSIAYKGFNLISATETQINFTVFEMVVGADGTLNEQIVEMSLEKEDDDQWRLVQERVLIENDAMRNHELSNAK